MSLKLCGGTRIEKSANNTGTLAMGSGANGSSPLDDLQQLPESYWSYCAQCKRGRSGRQSQ